MFTNMQTSIKVTQMEELLAQLCCTNVAFCFLSLTHFRCTVLLCFVLSDPPELNV